MWINLLVDVYVITLLLDDVVAGVGATAADRAEATRHLPPLPRPMARAVLLDAVRRADAMVINSMSSLFLCLCMVLVVLV